MFILTMMPIMMMINMIFIMMIHLLSITLLIILQTFMFFLIIGPISYSFWFSYILFLIFLGGMLVLFIDITKLTSNELLLLPTKSIPTLLFSKIFLLMLMIFNYIPSSFPYKYDSVDNNLMNISMENNVNQWYNYPNLMLMIMTILYLLLTLIFVVKITHIQEGPLRHLN